MSSSAPQFSPAEWAAVFDRFHASGLSQVAFCQAENLRRYSFAYHYRRSDKFAGVRRAAAPSDIKSEQKGSGFRTVQQTSISGAEPLEFERMSIHIGDNSIRLHCSATVGVEVIVRMMREAQS